MEDAGACRLVGLHAQKRGQSRLFGYRTAICFLRQAGLVSLDGRGRIDGVCGCDVVGASPVRDCPCLERMLKTTSGFLLSRSFLLTYRQPYASGPSLLAASPDGRFEHPV